MISNKRFSSDGTNKIYIVESYIPSDSHCRVYVTNNITEPIDNQNQLDITEYDIINNNVVLVEAPIVGKIITILVATTPDEFIDDIFEADGYAGLAKLWATEIVDTEVEPGLYSSYHWNVKTQLIYDNTGLLVDTSINDSLSIYTSTIEGYLSESETYKDNSYDYSQLSKNYANANEDIQVELGLFSSKHWSIKSYDFYISTQELYNLTLGYKDDAQDARNSAINAQNNAEGYMNNSLLYSNTALTYKNLANKYANETVDIEVETGLFSAKHWSIKSLNTYNNIGITHYTKIDTDLLISNIINDNSQNTVNAWSGAKIANYVATNSGSGGGSSINDTLTSSTTTWSSLKIAQEIANGVGGNILATDEEFTATNGQTTFNISGGYIVGLIEVYFNGRKLISSDFEAIDTNTISLTVPATTGDIINTVNYEITTGIGSVNADDVIYSNLNSQLLAESSQDAIDELDGVINLIESDIITIESDIIDLQNATPTIQVDSITVSTLLTSSNQIVLTNNDITITLPNVVSGIKFDIKNIDGSNVTIDTNDIATIDGNLDLNLTTQYESITLICDGSNWYII